MLNLGSECHSLSYDALTAHVTLVFIRYMFLSLQKRLCDDGRSFGELFFSVVDEIADISFYNAIRLIIDLLLQSLKEVFGFTDCKLDMLVDDFRKKLPPLVTREPWDARPKVFCGCYLYIFQGLPGGSHVGSLSLLL